MKSYFIRQDNKPQGPYSIDQLKEMKLNPAVLVWAEGLKQWIKALEIPELKQELFTSASQPGAKFSTIEIHSTASGPNTNRFAFAKNLKTILAVIALFIATLLLIELKKSKPRGAEEKTVKQSVNAVATQPSMSHAIKASTDSRNDAGQKEMVNPAAYIKGDVKWRKNLVGSIILEGTLRNTATQTSFKDPVILVNWLSKSNESLGSNQFPINKLLPAGETVAFKCKVSAPSKIGDARISVVSATAIP